MIAETIAASVLIVFVALTTLRMVLAHQMFARASRTSVTLVPEAAVTVLQPILGGDPTLEQNLRENLEHHPDATFLWLLDEDDDTGRRAATAAIAATAAAPDRVRVIDTPAVVHGANPKTFKLRMGLARCQTTFVAVLDDDTVLRPGTLGSAAAMCARNHIVTGLPYYEVRGAFWSTLLTAFVNANAAVTYLPVARVSAPATINGMFYLVRRDDLFALGGYDRIVTALCDDHAMAQLYIAAGGRIVQSCLAHPIRTTVEGAGHYARVIRRWMIFAHRFIAAHASAPVIGLVLLPSVLPLAVAVTSAVAGPRWIALGALLLVGKATAMAAFRRKWLGTREGLSTVTFEVLADLLAPLESVVAMINPSRLSWRSRRIDLSDGEIRYR